MALIICEGLDRTGKTTIAKYYESLGYQIVHMSAPSKNHTSDSFMQEMVDLISDAAYKDLFLDRSYYGEALIWPKIYNREALLSEEQLDALIEIENTVGVQRIWTTDDDIQAHWKRCVDNKEPIDRIQFSKARALYSSMAQKYNFQKMTLHNFIDKNPEAQRFITNNTENITVEKEQSTYTNKEAIKSLEQTKLEKANAINDILSKKILKNKNEIYEELETEIRDFLNLKLSSLFGTQNELSLSKEEVVFYKAMYKKATKGS